MILFFEDGVRILEVPSVFLCFHLNLIEVLQYRYFIVIVYALKIVKGKKVYMKEAIFYSQ